MVGLYREIDWYRRIGGHLGSFKLSPETPFKVGDSTCYAGSQDKAVLDKFVDSTNKIGEDSSFLRQLESLDEERSQAEATVERFRKALDKVIVESSIVTTLASLHK
jgi:hypothetical protein